MQSCFGDADKNDSSQDGLILQGSSDILQKASTNVLMGRSRGENDSRIESLVLLLLLLRNRLVEESANNWTMRIELEPWTQMIRAFFFLSRFN